MKPREWFWLLLLPVVAMAVPAHAKDYGIDRWTSEQGLPQNTVRCLLQTKDGYLWIGTGYGLARYDGVRFKGFTSEMMIASPDSIRVMEMAEDSDGVLWIRTEHGLISYEQARFRQYSVFENPLKGNIYKMHSRRRGGLWLAMEDGLKHFQDGKILRSYTQRDGLPGNRSLPMTEDSKGRIWLLHDPSGWKPDWGRLDPETEQIVPLETIIGEPLDGVQAVHEDRSGKLWFSVPGAMVAWEDGRLARHPIPHVAYQSSDGCEIKEGRDGDLWFKDGLTIVRFDRGQVTTFSHTNGLADGDLRCVLPDREGSTWIGTGSGGLNRIRPRPLTTLFSSDAEGGKNEVYSVSSRQSDRVWLGTGSGLFLWQEGRLTNITNHKVNIHGKITRGIKAVLEDRSGVIWLGLEDDGLNRVEAGRICPVPLPGIGPTREWSVRSFLEDRAGRLWIGTDRLGLGCLDDGKFTFFEPKDGLLHPWITSLREAPDGSLWIGTLGGVNHWKNGAFRAFTTRDGLLANRATVVMIEADGTAWVSTPKGLNRIRGNEIRSVTAREGLVDNMSYSLMEDGLGNFWSHCNRGIWRVRKAELHAVADGRASLLQSITFGEGDGMISAEGNGEQQPNATRTDDARLWFPTTRGVVVVDPAKAVEDKVTPPVVLEQVIVEDEVRYGEESNQGLGIPVDDASPRVSLGAGSVHVIEFRYTANSFIASEKVRFKYRLEGYDQGWRYGGANRAAFYTNVRPGNYRFQVTAANHHGYWNEQGASFAFRVDPRFWQTWPFYLLCGIGVLGLIGTVQANRLRWQRQMLKLEERQALADERTRIARDLHDDLGTALIGLALELDVSRQRKANALDLPQKLAEAARHARELAERMREVVWAVNPRCDTVQSLADFLQQQTGQLLRSSEFQVRFDFPEDIPRLLVNSEMRHQLALSAREALANVVRHAGASKVTLSLAVINSVLVVSVADNGCGFVPDIVGESSPRHGLANLRDRLAEVGGTFECDSAPGRGTTVTFRIPLESALIETRAMP